MDRGGRRKAQSTCLGPGAKREGKEGGKRGCPGLGRSSGGEWWPQWVAVSCKTGPGRCRPWGQEGGHRARGLLASPCPQAVRLVAVPGGGVAGRRCPQVALLPLNSPTGKCLTWVGHWAASWKNLMSLHSTPSMDTGGDREGVRMTRAAGEGRGLPATPSSNPHAHTSQHGLLLLSRADEAADALDDLAFRIHLLFSRLLAQEDGGNWKASGSHVVTAPGKVAALSPTHCPLSLGRAVIRRKQTPYFPQLRLSVSRAMSQDLQAPALLPGPWYLH